MSVSESPLPRAADRPIADHDDLLARLYSGHALTRRESRAVFKALVDGELGETRAAAMFVALRLRGETVEELIGAATALREADAPFVRPDYVFADTCGTGGDGAGTINISTAVAFVAAAAGLPVAKHGNRSFTSKCGSADVLEHLGAKLDASAETSRRALDQTGFCFLFAPQYHPGARHAGPARKALKVRTIMNVLGPCVNPAEPAVQLLGVAEERLLEPVAQTLIALGVERALVVHGAGLDEVALHAPSQAILIQHQSFERIRIRPEAAGFNPQPREMLEGGDVAENAARLRAVLRGEGGEGDTQAVALNTGALLMTAGLAADIREGAAKALDTLRTGAPSSVLDAFIKAARA